MALWLQIVLWALAGIFGICLLVSAVRGGKPIRTLLSSATQGLCALGLVNLLGTFTGVSIGFSWLATGAGLILGIPGVIGMLLLNVVLVYNLTV